MGNYLCVETRTPVAYEEVRHRKTAGNRRWQVAEGGQERHRLK